MGKPRIVDETEREIPQQAPPQDVVVRGGPDHHDEVESFLRSTISDPTQGQRGEGEGGRLRATPGEETRLYLAPEPAEALVEHCYRLSLEPLEAMGLLLGDVREHGGTTYVTVERTLTAELHTTPVSARFDRTGLTELSGKLDDLDEDYVIVGWYHSHPGYTCFMSSTDLRTQRRSFTEPYHCALVVDPVNLEMKTFGLRDGELWEYGYAIARDVGRSPAEPEAVEPASAGAEAQGSETWIRSTPETIKCPQCGFRKLADDLEPGDLADCVSCDETARVPAPEPGLIRPREGSEEALIVREAIRGIETAVDRTLHRTAQTVSGWAERVRDYVRDIDPEVAVPPAAAGDPAYLPSQPAQPRPRARVPAVPEGTPTREKEPEPPAVEDDEPEPEPVAGPSGGPIVAWSTDGPDVVACPHCAETRARPDGQPRYARCGACGERARLPPPPSAPEPEPEASSAPEPPEAEETPEPDLEPEAPSEPDREAEEAPEPPEPGREPGASAEASGGNGQPAVEETDGDGGLLQGLGGSQVTMECDDCGTTVEVRLSLRHKIKPKIVECPNCSRKGKKTL